MQQLEAALAKFGPVDRKQIQEELSESPSFRPKLEAMLRLPDAERAVVLSAKRAVANEFNPKLYPETRGEWAALRKRSVALAGALPEIVDGIVERMPFEAKMATVRAIAAGERPQLVLAGMGDLGQFEIIGSIISSVAGAASGIYGAKVTASAQKDIAKIQANAAMQSASAQIAMANAQSAIQQAQAQQMTAAAQQMTAASPAGFLTQNIGGGVPFWAVPAALSALGLGVLVYFKTRKKGR